MAVYALNLFAIEDRDEYLAYTRRAPAEVAKHGGRAIALGRFQEAVTGDIAAPRGAAQVTPRLLRAALGRPSHRDRATTRQ